MGSASRLRASAWGKRREREREREKERENNVER